ncbi:MAG: N-acetylmuramoyl-L-alanine amidase [Paludibacteraceae bacterium]|nr:N-acetylmuramoyl-L-alanine amidase [Paludibacteraceae bacterium]
MKCPLLSLTILLFVLPFLSVSAENASSPKRITVVIDAGHGGKDPGAIGSVLKLKEKDVNLSVALELGRLLYAEPGFKVIYTRKTDVFIPLDERAQKANKEKADLFISIHANATPNKAAYGTETYVVGSSSKENMAVAMRENASILYEENYKARYGGFDPNKSESYIMFDMMQSSFLTQSIDLAQRVQKQFVSTCKRSDRSVKQAGFLVLRQTNMPSILVELGYLSNPKEEKYLKKDSSRKALAKAIFEAVVKYKAAYENKNVSVDEAPAEKSELLKSVVDEKKDSVVLKQDTTTNKSKSVSKDEKKDSKSDVQDTICYRVQFCSSKTKLALNSKSFKSCAPAYEYYENNIYKYMYGKATSFSEAIELQKRVRKDFKDAFVVVMKGNKKLPPSEASRYLK